jgi:hypothetical protein
MGNGCFLAGKVAKPRYDGVLLRTRSDEVILWNDHGDIEDRSSISDHIQFHG